jgi:hypothetical protein
VFRLRIRYEPRGSKLKGEMCWMNPKHQLLLRHKKSGKPVSKNFSFESGLDQDQFRVAISRCACLVPECRVRLFFDAA